MADTLTQAQLDQVLAYVKANTSKRLPEYDNLVSKLGSGLDLRYYATSWTSTSGTPSIGNGTLKLPYSYLGNKVFFELIMVFDSSSSYGGAGGLWKITLPEAKYDEPGILHTSTFLGQVFESGSTALYQVVGRLNGNTNVMELNVSNSNGTRTEYNNLTPSDPITFNAGDTLTLTGWYFYKK